VSCDHAIVFPEYYRNIGCRGISIDIKKPAQEEEAGFFFREERTGLIMPYYTP